MLLTSALGVITLAACNKSAAPIQPDAANVAVAPVAPLPLDTSVPMSAPATAPLAGSLPSAPPARVSAPKSRQARYDYVNRAADLNSGFADSPPDYAVDYQGSRPWVWRAQNGSSRVVESTPEGERYYYYESGADQPYLVRDSRYTYGYERGQLAVVYDAYGRPLPDGSLKGQAILAGRFLARAQALFAAVQQQRHEAAYAANWQARQAALMQQRQVWERQQKQDVEWRAWSAQHAAEDAAWRREADARRATSAPQYSQPYSAPPEGRRPDQRVPYPVQQQPGLPAAPPRIDTAAQARAQQAQADANHQAQLADQVRLADQARRRQAQIQAQAQAELEARAQADARARVADQARSVEQARLAEQARRQQAQAEAMRQVQQARQADQVQRQRAQAEAKRQNDVAAQAARKHQKEVQAEAQAAADTARHQNALVQAEAQRKVEGESRARAKASQAAVDAAARKPRPDRQDRGEPRNEVTPQP